MIDPIAFVKLYSLYNLGLAIAEAVILHDNNDAKNACGPQIWTCILVHCILRFVSIGMSVVVYRQKAREDEPVTLTVQAQFNWVALIGIWAAYVFHSTDGDCKSLFQDQYPNLWNVVAAETITLYILLGVSVLFFCCGRTRIIVMNASDRV